jgi:hypothetical protein
MLGCQPDKQAKSLEESFQCPETLELIEYLFGGRFGKYQQIIGIEFLPAERRADPVNHYTVVLPSTL